MRKAVEVLENLAGTSLVDIGTAAGLEPSTVKKNPNTVLKNPVIQGVISNQMSKVLFELKRRDPKFEETLAEKIEEGMQATRAISAIIKSGKQREADESTTDFIEVPDFGVRHKYVMTALELMGEIGGDRKQQAQNVLNIGMLVEIVRQSEKERGLEPL